MDQRRIEVGVAGATGAVGQQFVALLANHPWFRLAWVGASQRSEGRRYGDLPWRLPTPMPEGARELRVEAPAPGRAPRLVFSALDAGAAGDIEVAFAKAGHLVCSNARSHRMDPLVPLVIPEVNPDHLCLVPRQRRARGWTGAIVTNPNCSTIVLALSLAPLRPFEPRRVTVATLQAASGAGYPGVASLDLLGNVIPVVDGEEEKIERETNKILGRLDGAGVEPHPVAISAQTTRVPVVNGHTELIGVGFVEPPSLDALRDAFVQFTGRPQERRLPSAPDRPIVYLEQSDRPQPRLDVERGAGMTITVGRLRACPVLDCKFVALGHNTVRGAAGAAILNAELMAVEGLFDEAGPWSS